MKKFDLQEALQGKPVLLRNNCIAYIIQVLPENSNEPNVSEGYRIKGSYLDSLHGDSIGIKWRLNGQGWNDKYDIVGMYEENIKDIIQKAYQKNLPLKTRNNTKVFISTIVKDTNELTEKYSVFGYSTTTDCYRWTLNGKFLITTNDLDIVGLWQE